MIFDEFTGHFTSKFSIVNDKHAIDN